MNPKEIPELLGHFTSGGVSPTPLTPNRVDNLIRSKDIFNCLKGWFIFSAQRNCRGFFKIVFLAFYVRYGVEIRRGVSLDLCAIEFVGKLKEANPSRISFPPSIRSSWESPDVALQSSLLTNPRRDGEFLVGMPSGPFYKMPAGH